jgi:hypothetical protein
LVGYSPTEADFFLSLKVISPVPAIRSPMSSRTANDTTVVEPTVETALK